MCIYKTLQENNIEQKIISHGRKQNKSDLRKR